MSVPPLMQTVVEQWLLGTEGKQWLKKLFVTDILEHIEEKHPEYMACTSCSQDRNGYVDRGVMVFLFQVIQRHLESREKATSVTENCVEQWIINSSSSAGLVWLQRLLMQRVLYRMYDAVPEMTHCSMCTSSEDGFLDKDVMLVIVDEISRELHEVGNCSSLSRKRARVECKKNDDDDDDDKNKKICT